MEILLQLSKWICRGVEKIESICGMKTCRTMVKMFSLTHQKKIRTLKGKKKKKDKTELRWRKGIKKGCGEMGANKEKYYFADY